MLLGHEANATANGFHSGPSIGICTRSADIRRPDPTPESYAPAWIQLGLALGLRLGLDLKPDHCDMAALGQPNQI